MSEHAGGEFRVTVNVPEGWNEEIEPGVTPLQPKPTVSGHVVQPNGEVTPVELVPEKHPGPCDGFGPNYECSMCSGQRPPTRVVKAHASGGGGLDWSIYKGEHSDENVPTREEFVAFLGGERAIQGVWFGDSHPAFRGRYWWRRYLHLLRASEGEKP